MLVHDMKSPEVNKLMKVSIINNWIKKICVDKEPILIAEEIATQIFGLVDKYCLNKYQQDFISPKILFMISSSDDFKCIRENISKLQVKIYFDRRI